MKSAFADRAAPPDDGAVHRVLGASAPAWDECRAAIARAHPPVDAEWVWGGAPHGWALRLRRKKRAIVYLAPHAGSFHASFAVGEKAAAAARDAGLAEHLLQAIADAPRYVEGRAVRIEVAGPAAVADVLAVAALKMGH